LAESEAKVVKETFLIPNGQKLDNTEGQNGYRPNQLAFKTWVVGIMIA
jgi:hypothetical protein